MGRLPRPTPSGHFAFDVSPLERFTIRAQKEGHGAVESDAIDASSNSPVVLVLLPVFAVTGRITDERGRAIPGAVAKLWGSPDSEQVVPSKEDGSYEMSPVGPGVRHLTVWARGFTTVTHELRVDWHTAAHDVRLPMSPAVRGVVVDPEGRPIALAHVSACEGDDEENALSDEDGRFDLPSITVGCTVSAHHPRFAAARPKTIAASGELSVQLEPGGAIEGVATNGRGRRVGSFSVTITSFEPAPGELSEARIGDSRDELRGAFRFDGLSPGEYGLSVQADGMLGWTSMVRVTSGKVSRGVHAILLTDPSETVEEPVETTEPTETVEEEETVEPAETTEPPESGEPAGRIVNEEAPADPT